MSELSLPYGRDHISFEIDPRFRVDKIIPIPSDPLDDAESAIQNELENPLSKFTLKDFISSGSVGIAINDKTRPVPDPNPVLILLNYLENLGFPQNSIKIFIGSGTHKPMLENEYNKILPAEIYENYAIFTHDCDHSPMVNLGKTKFNSPIIINKAYFTCDLKIAVGNIEPHHFMGFSGGVKTAAIGLAGRETITANHAMLTDDRARSGSFDTNPLRKEIEEIGRKAKIHFTLGSILDENKKILKVFFGEPETVMLAAIPDVKKLFGVEVSGLYDLVIASPGGYPKDINLYQSEKGLTHAAQITKDDGWVILLAECPEGSGSKSYEDYAAKVTSNESIIKDFERGYFQIGQHKAYQIAREAQRVNIVLVSNIPPENIKRWHLTPGQPQYLNQIINRCIEGLPKDPRIAIMPSATRTMTELKDE